MKTIAIIVGVVLAVLLLSLCALNGMFTTGGGNALPPPDPNTTPSPVPGSGSITNPLYLLLGLLAA